MPTTKPPGLATAAGCTIQDAGRDWDAVRVPRSVGLATVAILGPRCGAVIDDGQMVLYFFIPAGVIWSAPNTRSLGSGSSLTVPPARRTSGPGPYWRICPGDSDGLTDPEALRAAIEDVLGPTKTDPTA